MGWRGSLFESPGQHNENVFLLPGISLTQTVTLSCSTNGGRCRSRALDWTTTSGPSFEAQNGKIVFRRARALEDPLTSFLKFVDVDRVSPEQAREILQAIGEEDVHRSLEKMKCFQASKSAEDIEKKLVSLYGMDYNDFLHVLERRHNSVFDSERYASSLFDFSKVTIMITDYVAVRLNRVADFLKGKHHA